MLSPESSNERFRQRREQARRRRRRRRFAAVAILALAAAASTLGARFVASHGDKGAGSGAADESTGASAQKAKAPTPRPLPEEMRGVHVTMALANLSGKLDEYFELADQGLNTLELDVKDENGEVAFPSKYAPLARKIGAARPYYRPHEVAREAHANGLYLIGRVVVFEDPILGTKRPDLAIRRPDGSVWTTSAGLAWVNEYDKRVWKYDVDVAESAARAGFDEIMFDYVRFPSDGDIASAIWPGKVNEAKGQTIMRFLEYARSRLHPLGVRVGAAVFGLSATRDLGIGQKPRKIARYLDTIYPMVYPSHYGSGEYDLSDPDATPGRTVSYSLRDFQKKLRGRSTKLIPWLQDFTLGETYTLTQVQDQIEAARRYDSSGYLLWNAAGVYTDGSLEGR
jgi:hypothetical protein